MRSSAILALSLLASGGRSEELNAIRPESRASWENSTYCLLRYRSTLSREDGPVLYVCAASATGRPAGLQFGRVVPIDHRDGGLRYYHVPAEADLAAEDAILNTFAEPHPPAAWFYDGTDQSLILVGYVKYGPTPPDLLVRFYDGRGKLRGEFSRKVSRRVAARLSRGGDGDRLGIVGGWSEEGGKHLFLIAEGGVCLRIERGDGRVQEVPATEVLLEALAGPSTRFDALKCLNLLEEKDIGPLRGRLKALARDRTVAAETRLMAAWLIARLGDAEVMETLAEFAFSRDAELRALAEEGLERLRQSGASLQSP